MANIHQDSIDKIEDSVLNNTNNLETYRRLKSNYKAITKVLVENEDPSILEDVHGMELLLDVNIVILIALLDLGVISKNMILANGSWERIYFIKQSCLTIYETLRSYSTFQKQLKDIFLKDDNFKEEFDSIAKSFREYKRKHGYDTRLVRVRNMLAGHIHEDFLSYYDLAASLDAQSAFEAISELLPVLNKMQTLATQKVNKHKLKLDERILTFEKLIQEKLNEIVKTHRK